MRFIVFLLPWLELFTLIQLGIETSALTALMYVLVTLFLGLALLQRQGRELFEHLRESQRTGTAGAQVLLDRSRRWWCWWGRCGGALPEPCMARRPRATRRSRILPHIRPSREAFAAWTTSRCPNYLLYKENILFMRAVPGGGRRLDWRAPGTRIGTLTKRVLTDP